MELGKVIEEARLRVWKTMGRLGSGGPGKPEAGKCKVDGKTKQKKQKIRSQANPGFRVCGE